jgi:hypothetical protein
MSYVLQQLQEYYDYNIEAEIEATPENRVRPGLLIKIDHHHNRHSRDSYDGGLSFIDRINAKIGRFNPEWDIEAMKHQIRSSPYPQLEYVAVITQMFAKKGMIAYYGL